MLKNDPDTVREIEAAFAAYDKALLANDVDALNGFFHNDPSTVRFGHAENLYGFDEIAAFRASRTMAPNQKRLRTVVTTWGKDFATVATLSQGGDGSRTGRTMQTWVRLPQGWRIVAAHVSSIPTPAS